MKSILKFAFIGIGVVFLLAIIGGFLLNTKQLQNILSFSQKYLPESSSVLPDVADESKIKTFRAEDGSVEISYPADWLELPSAISGKTPKIASGPYNSETIFRAGGFTIEGASAQILVARFSSNKKLSIEQIISDMEKNNTDQEWDMQVNDLQLAENEGLFEATYSNSQGNTLRSKEKLLLKQSEKITTAYSIAVISQEEDWQKFEDEANSIIASSRLVL